MSQPTKRKNTAAKPRARSDSARLFADAPKKQSPKINAPSTKVRPSTKSASAPKVKAAHKAPQAHVPKTELGGAPLLWTKDQTGVVNKERSLLSRIFSGIAGFFVLIFRAIGSMFRHLFSLLSRSKVALALAAFVVVALVGGLVDMGLNWEKVYPGIKIGDIDLSGKTTLEAQELVEDAYAARLSGKAVYVFANEEASKNPEESLRITEELQSDDQQSVEVAHAGKLVWKTDAANLAATLDTTGMVNDAFSYGRENGGLLSRLQALFFGHSIEPRARYNQEALEALAADIDLTIGEPRVNFNISVVEGNAVVTDGHDGNMINRDTFQKELDTAFLSSNEENAHIVAHAEYAPLQITWEMAQQTCEKVNSSIVYGAMFSYGNTAWTANAIDLGSWIDTRVETSGEGYVLQPFLDYAKAKPSLIAHLKANFENGEGKIRFSLKDGVPVVHSDTQGTIPLSQKAVDALNEYLFADDAMITAQPRVTVESTSIPNELSLSEALDSGIISRITEYTTEYTANVTARNHNIHLASDLLNNSIIKADGGSWSFNETAGNCNAEAGFQGAGSIVDGEYVDEIGGGICQVATTVFNAVYNSGFPVAQRHNHSLYIASYPAGRDAAVSWPDLDLRWENDSSSDVLLSMSYTESTVTATLYGVNPGYSVSTETGDWEEGKKYKTKTVVDDTLTPGTSYIKTQGTDGQNITVIRTVKDKSGAIIRQNTFVSNYDPKDEVKVEGPAIAGSDTSKTETQATT